VKLANRLALLGTDEPSIFLPHLVSMSSYGLLTVGSIVVGEPQNKPSPELLSVFRDDMIRMRTVPGTEYYETADRPADEEIRTAEFRAPGAHIRQRLDLLGIDEALILERLNAEFVYEETEISSIVDRQLDEILDEIRDEHLIRLRQENIEFRRSLDGPSWVTHLGNSESTTAATDTTPGSRWWLMEVINDWQWPYALRAVLMAFPDAEVSLDVTELAQGGWLGEDHDFLASGALEELRDSAAVHAPVIVLTEGTTDAEFLAKGVSILYPYLTDLIRFLDYERKPEGGIGALLNMIRSFAAAGIANRVIAVHDNDTAAADGLRKLDLNGLPSRMRVLPYPDLDLARNYPTLGPPSLDCPDVSIGNANLNGSACSIEMYLGKDVLTLDGGDLRPVQWTSYISGIGRYQGEITNKKEIHARFRAKYLQAQENPEIIKTQDWSGLKLIIDMLLSSFTDNN
jgi:HEPN/Toprim N-terminal domain 1